MSNGDNGQKYRTIFDCTLKQWVGILFFLLTLAFSFGAAFSQLNNIEKRVDKIEKIVDELREIKGKVEAIYEMTVVGKK